MVNFIEYSDIYREQTKNLIIEIAVEEYGLYEHKEIFSAEDFYQYKKNKGNFWLAVNEKNEVIGTVAIKRKLRYTVELKRMYLRKEYRGQGISKDLLGIAIRFCRDNKYKKLIVSTCNQMERATAFYRKHGFIEHKHKKGIKNQAKYYYMDLI